jgi:hypothetical protein
MCDQNVGSLLKRKGSMKLAETSRDYSKGELSKMGLSCSSILIGQEFGNREGWV